MDIGMNTDTCMSTDIGMTTDIGLNRALVRMILEHGRITPG